MAGLAAAPVAVVDLVAAVGLVAVAVVDLLAVAVVGLAPALILVLIRVLIPGPVPERGRSVLKKMYLRKTGFTLVEVLVATTIGTFIALVAIGALRAVTAGAQVVEANINTAAEVRFAARTIRHDLVNMYRTANKRDTKFIAIADTSGAVPTSYLVFYAVNRTKARSQQPEGDVYEVEYYVKVDEDKSMLMRRLWPNPTDDLEPGGMLSVIAEGIEVFEARFFDGTEWTYEWSEEMTALPLLVELNIAATQETTGRPVTETIYVNFARSTGTTLEEEQTESETQSN